MNAGLARSHGGRRRAVIWDVAPFLPVAMGVRPIDYYRSSQVKLEVQSAFQRRFPEAVLYPGLWADYGTVVEASAFGCDITWLEGDAPYAAPCMTDIDDVDGLTLPRPDRDGLMPTALADYRYMWEHADRRLLDEYGYLDGTLYCMGPLETAALVAGYERFFISMYDKPNAATRLLTIVTETILKWLHAQEQVNGHAQRLFVADHVPSQISRDFFLEFGLPAFKAIFSEFPGAMRLWHNEGRVSHIADCLDQVGCEIFHCGDDIEALCGVSTRVVFMGNLPPVELLLHGTPNRVAARVTDLMQSASDASRLLVSTAGGMAPGTPLENIDAMVRAAEG